MGLVGLLSGAGVCRMSAVAAVDTPRATSNGRMHGARPELVVAHVCVRVAITGHVHAAFGTKHVRYLPCVQKARAVVQWGLSHRRKAAVPLHA